MDEHWNRWQLRRWLTQARYDREAAKRSACMGHFDWACFQAQRAAGKALKGYLYSHGWRMVACDSLARLLPACEAIAPEFEQVAAAQALDRYCQPGREPYGSPGPARDERYHKERAEQCISWATAVIELVERLSSTGELALAG